MAALRTPARREFAGVDPVAHNLQVLTGPERQRLAPSTTDLERELGLRFVLRAGGQPSAARVRITILADHG